MAYTFKHGDRPLDDFTIQRAVGAGGFGEVYYAVSDGGREVALKYLKSNPQIELRGVSHCINLKSPYLVSIFDVKKNADGEYFIIMEYCSGPSLRDLLIAEPNGFEPQKAAFFLREIGKGLAYLHDRGIVHRDLKPGNIFYDDGYVKIGDYGLSKFISISRHSAQTASIGTVHYMAPEIGSGNYSRGVDIYALGVILYEMLMGKVPFEGSSMAEVLMKHLTTQPELDELPHPYGSVLRKTLQKDPKDRYQSVDEMIEELLTAEDIKESLAGFSTQSLEGAVRRGGADAARSPVPSPNPPRGFGQPFAKPIEDRPEYRPPPMGVPRGDVGLPERLAKKHDKRTRRVEQRMAKLAGKAGRPMPPPPPGPGGVCCPPKAAGVCSPPMVAAGDGHHRPRRRALPFFLTGGLAIALGVLVANGLDNEDAGFSAGLLTVMMALGVTLSRRAVGWFDVPYGKNWASRVIHAACCAPLLALGAMPLLDSRLLHEQGLAIYLGLLVVAVLADWRKQFDRGATGDMSFGSALWVAFGGFAMAGIIGAMNDIEEPGFFLIAAGVAGITALVAQAIGARPPAGVPADGAAVATGSRGGAEESPKKPVPPPAPQGGASDAAACAPPIGSTPADVPQEDPAARLQRWDVTRAFWGVFSFLLAGGAIITAFLVYFGDFCCGHAKGCGDETGVLVGSIACASVLIFAIRKTTPVKQPGFLREWVRPFLITIGLFGIGSLGVTAWRHWCHLCGDEQALVSAGSVFSGMLLLVASLLGHRRDESTATEPQDDSPAELRRSPSARAIWGVFSFLLAGGAIITGMLAAMGDFGWRGDRTGVWVGCIACVTVLIFALRKTARFRQPGFLREWLRPFLITISLFGLASLGVVARHWATLHSEEKGLTAAGLTVSFLLLVVSSSLWRKPGDSRPFLVPEDSGSSPKVRIGVFVAGGDDDAGASQEADRQNG